MFLRNCFLFSLFFGTFVFCSASIDARRTEQILRRVDQLLEGPPPDHINAYELLLNYEEELSDGIEYKWRIAKACRLSALAYGARGNEDKKKELCFRSFEYGKKALEFGSNHSQVQKWYAVTLGGLSDYVGAGEKIKNGVTFKEHIKRALEINPNDGELHYLIGRFNYEVAILSWFERRMAAALFSEVPTSTIEEALGHFMLAEKFLVKPIKESRLYLARCHIQNYNYAEAMYWIDKGLEVSTISTEDEAAEKELRNLEWKYSGYRRH